MQELKKEELIKLRGGGLSLAAGCLIVAGVVFLIGVIDGYTRPLKCHK